MGSWEGAVAVVMDVEEEDVGEMSLGCDFSFSCEGISRS